MYPELHANSTNCLILIKEKGSSDFVLAHVWTNGSGNTTVSSIANSVLTVANRSNSDDSFTVSGVSASTAYQLIQLAGDGYINNVTTA